MRARIFCDKNTRLKYQIDQAKEGGAECSAEIYCPKGSTTATSVKCPAEPSVSLQEVRPSRTVKSDVSFR
jgi:hypothetical protein